MDWTLAITRNRDALKPIIAAMCAMAGMRSGRVSAARKSNLSPTVTLPRHVIATILLILRPAESAVRRLVVILAALAVSDRQTAAQLHASVVSINTGNSSREPKTPAFALFDPLKSFDPDSIWGLDEANESGFSSGDDAEFVPASNWRVLPGANEPLPAASILRRLAAIRRALDTLPYQARRLLRFNAKRDTLLKKPFTKPIRLSPMRPGLPLGWRQRSIHQIDPILKECHLLANDLLCALNSS